MANSVEKEERGSFFVVRVAGEFSVRTLRDIRDAIEEALTVGHTHIGFDLSQTEFIDSGGIGLIMNTYKRMAENGGTPSLVAISESLEDIIETSGIRQILPVYSDLDDLEKEVG